MESGGNPYKPRVESGPVQRLSLLMVLACGFLWSSTPLLAQEASAPEAPVTEPLSEPPASPETPAEPTTPVVEEPATEEATTPEPQESTPPAEEPSEATEPAADESEAAEAVEDETVAVVAAEATDWAGIMERAPAFIALTHHAAVHLPIALWLMGAFFVLVGVVAPSWRNQIPMACLLGGSATSIVAAASGWWYAAYEWGEDWAWGDGFSFEEHLDKHRWTGVMLVVASLILSSLALISQAKKGEAKKLAIFWRLGLLALAAAVAWEGHVGGEMIHGEGFLEEAFEVWINGEE